MVAVLAAAMALLLRLLWQSEAAYWSDACAWLCLWLAWLVPTVAAPAPGTAALGDGSAWAAACAAPPAGNGNVWPARWPCSAPANAASHASPADADAGAGAGAADAAACSCCAFAAWTWSAICAGASMWWPQLDEIAVPIAAVGSAGRWIDCAACHARIHPDPYRPRLRRCHHLPQSHHYHHRHRHRPQPPPVFAACD